MPALAGGGLPVDGLEPQPAKVRRTGGGRCAPSRQPAELCRDTDIVLLCLADTAVVREVVFGEQGIAQGGRAGQLLVDFSSLEPTATREMAAELAALCGMAWLDAPVSGGTPGAEAGTLAIMVGGEAQDLERVRPVLLTLGQRVTHMGGVGAGQVTKACNQMIVACNALVIAEVVALAEQSGVDARLIAEALAGALPTPSHCRSWRLKWLRVGSSRSSGMCARYSRTRIPQ